MSEPGWKDELREDLRWALAPHTGLHESAEAALTAVLPHVEAAYWRGLQAGRSQAGYQETRRKQREEEPCPSPSAPSASASNASADDA